MTRSTELCEMSRSCQSATARMPRLSVAGTLDIDERDPQKAFAPLIDYVAYTAIQNVTGQPAMSVPLGWSQGGLPIGAVMVETATDAAGRGTATWATSTIGTVRLQI